MDLPERKEPKPKPAGWFSLLLAAGVGILILLGLIMLSGGYLGLVIFVGGGVFALAAFHYLVWGWWLSEKLYREEAEADRREAAGLNRYKETPWWYGFAGAGFLDSFLRDDSPAKARRAANDDKADQRREESDG